ncbi:Transposable element tcb2 transposase, partial [Caligus rogercresseyi]
MSLELERRTAIIVALRCGSTPKEIIHFFKFPKATVYSIAKSFKESEDIEEGFLTPERKTPDRSQVRKRSADFIDHRLEAMINDDPSVPMSTLAERLNVHRTTVLHAIHEDLRCNSYVLRVRQMLSDTLKKKRLERCELLITSLKHRAVGRIRCFSDEKIFCVDAKINRQNDRWIASDPDEVPIIGITKFPAGVHVLEVMSSEGYIMPPHFFAKGQNVNKEVYLDVMQTVVKPWMTQIATGRPYLYQQDGAPAHTSNLVQNWCLENLDMLWSKEFWPPSSPDLNPSDYYLWGVLERDTKKRAHNTVDSLKAAIIQAVANLSREQ